jgi:hypothetical protein
MNQLLHQIRTSPTGVLEYSHDISGLAVWYW